MKRVYIAIKYSGCEELSYKKSMEACAEILNDGDLPISPIVMFHELSKAYELPGNFEYWRKINFNLIDSCDELQVVYGEGFAWKTSEGVVAEVAYAKAAWKDVSYRYM